MFLMGLIFFLVLVLTFGIVLVMTRPTAAERTIEGRIAKLRGAPKAADELDEDSSAIIKQTRLSKNPSLDALLRHWKLVRKIQKLIARAESLWSVSGVLAWSLGLAIAGYAIGYYELPSLAIALLPALVCAALPFLFLRYQHTRRLKRIQPPSAGGHRPDEPRLARRSLPDGGHRDHWRGISRARAQRVSRGLCQQNFGIPAREALLQLARRIPLPELNFVVTAILLQKETGGNLVEVLDRTTAVIRERLRIQGEIRTHTAQGRLTGWILSLLPVAMFFLLSLANRGYTRVLIEDPTGRILIYTGVGLIVLGGLVIRKIVSVKI